jgi:hypothetical protein
MKKIFILVILLAVAFVHANAQVYIQPGAQLTATNTVFTFHNISVTNDDPATNIATCYVIVSGTVNSTLQGSANWLVKNLIVDKEAGIARLGANVQVTDMLQLSSGYLDLNAQVVTLSPGALLFGEADNARIIGPAGGFIQITVNIPTAERRNPGNLGAVITANQGLGTVTVKRWHNQQGGDFKVQRFYEIVPANNTGLNASVRFYYLDAELFGNEEAGLAMYTRANNLAAWSRIGSDVKDSVQNFVEKAALTSLQQYAITSISGSLPVKWGPVSTVCNNNEAEIKWTTLEETNVKHFIIQKNNGNQWTDLAIVPGKGSGANQQTYQYRDASPGAAYRIASVDHDGKRGYSIVMPLSGCSQKLVVTISPVPTFNDVKLTINTPLGFAANIRLLGSDAKIYQQRHVNLVAGINQVPINMQSLAAGVYYLLVQTPQGTRTLQVIKQSGK